MLTQYKKEYEKTAMGFLSYLPDFKNFQNLKQEMSIYCHDNDFQLYLFSESGHHFLGVIGIQIEKEVIMIRYLSLAPGFRNKVEQDKIITDLQNLFPSKMLMTVPDYSFLLKDVKHHHDN